jgi:hypothetical protein
MRVAHVLIARPQLLATNKYAGLAINFESECRGRGEGSLC